MRATSWIAFRPLWIAQRENRGARLSLPALHQWPPGTRQTPSAGHRRYNSIASVSQKTRPAAICWLISVRPGSATEAQYEAVAPAHASLSRHGCRSDAGFGPIRGVEVIALYQGLVRYELRCSKLYARTIVTIADWRHTGPAESVVLGDTCMVPRFTGSCRFGPFELSIGERILRREGEALPLGGRALDILIYLAERPGEVIAKQELMDRVWSDVTVEEGSLRVHVAAIRKALGDGQFGNRYIANIKGRGYSFVGTVVPLTGSTESRNDRSRQEGRLPARPLMMIGRETVVSEVSDKLRNERFVTLLGPGGIGKTTIALAVGRAAAKKFGEEVYFVDLEFLTDHASCPGGCRDIPGSCTQIERSLPGAGQPRSFAEASGHSR